MLSGFVAIHRRGRFGLFVRVFGLLLPVTFRTTRTTRQCARLNGS